MALSAGSVNIASGTESTTRVIRSSVIAAAIAASSFIDVTTLFEEYVILDQLKRRPRARLVHRLPVVLNVERGTVIDQPWTALPDEQIRIAVGSVGVRHEGIEPHDPRGELARNQLACRGHVEIE